jgi:chorismate mutase
MPAASCFIYPFSGGGMNVRGVRGATTVDQDQAEDILSATRELLQAILQANPAMQPENIASVLFTTTADLLSVYPARAAREMGWVEVPLMCMQEIPVTGSLRMCIRVILHWNTTLHQAEIRHVYLRKAEVLRPDLKPAASIGKSVATESPRFEGKEMRQ